MPKVRWGVLGVANIATEKVIPAMQRGAWSEVTAIASRDAARAQAAANRLGLAKAYGSYAELLADPDIDAIYNPLPNHLHLLWSTRAAEAGKHVLCEKPIGLNADEARQLVAVRDRTGVKIQEAFMVRTHPQWLHAMRLCRSGEIGDVRAYQGFFSYFNDDAGNIRNIEAFGGGALMDVGCYLVMTSRMIFGEEPRRVMAQIERDPTLGVDTLASLLLDYPSGQAIGTCSTRLVAFQRVDIFGTSRRIQIEIPFNAPNHRPCRLFVADAMNLSTGPGDEVSVETSDEVSFEPCDQYQIQGDLFSKAVLHGTDVPYPLEGSVMNMRIIDALFRSASSNLWEAP